MDRIGTRSLCHSRNVLASGAVARAAHAKRGAEGRRIGIGATRALLSPLLDLVRLRLPCFHLGHSDLLGNDRKAWNLLIYLFPPTLMGSISNSTRTSPGL